MLRIKFEVLEDILAPDLIDGEDTVRAHAPPALLAWWRAAMARLETHPRFATPNRNPDMVEDQMGRDEATIQVMLCSRASILALCDQETALGLHLINTPDTDPFGEEAPYGQEYRALVVSDIDEFLGGISEEAEEDLYQVRYISEYIEAYANTVFHEICHALLFAENANLLPPNDIASLSDSGEIHHDLFDHSTGYGMRPLLIDGRDLWADTAEEAGPMSEQYVEELGRELMYWVMTGDLHADSLLEAMGLRDKVDEIYRKGREEVLAN